MLYKDWEGYSKYIKIQQAKRGYFKFLKLEYLEYKLGAKKATIRPKVGTLRPKQLQELK